VLALQRAFFACFESYRFHADIVPLWQAHMTSTPSDDYLSSGFGTAAGLEMSTSARPPARFALGCAAS